MPLISNISTKNGSDEAASVVLSSVKYDGSSAFFGPTTRKAQPFFFVRGEGSFIVLILHLAVFNFLVGHKNPTDKFGTVR